VSLEPYVLIASLKPCLESSDKRSVIDELLGMLFDCGQVSDLDAARAAVWAREESMSTGMQGGLALPHGKTDSVVKTVCAVGLKPSGIDFDSLDEQPSTVIVLALSPPADSAAHLRFMSTASKVLNGEGKGRESLLACKTPEEMLAVLS
jgi:mannitol/fructose-specific phosphotransferase system IIA component (Ntr-type)